MTNEEIKNKVAELRELSRMADELNAEIEALKDDLKAEMNAENNFELHGSDYKITYHEVTQNKIDSTALKKDLPEIAKKYTKQSKYRRFLLV
jgi:predicted phage-related endonuclease